MHCKAGLGENLWGSAVGGWVGIYMWHGRYLQAPVGMQDQTDALYKLSNAYSSVLLYLRALKWHVRYCIGR